MRLSLALLLLTACQSQYDVRVSFVDSATRAVAARVQVAIVPTCAEQRLGGTPSNTVRLVEFAIDESAPAVGDLEPGDYGLYARAIGAECQVLAAGCTPIVIRKGGDGQLAVELSNIAMLPFCEEGTVCSGGACTAADAAVVDGGVSDAADGSTVDSDSGPDGGPSDAGPDTGPVDAAPDTTDAGPSCEPLDGLVGSWPMNRDTVIRPLVLDDSGNDFHGMIARTGTLSVVDVVPRGEVLDFTESVDARIELPDLPIEGVFGSSMTVAMWFFTSNSRVDNTLVFMDSPTGLYDLWVTARGAETALCINTANGDCWGITRGDLVGRWVHVAAVFASGRTDGSQLYVDGLPVAMACQFGSCEQSRSVSNPVRLGGNSSYPWLGQMDDVQIFDRALTPDEAARVFACTE